jgi:hypothetical protein
MLGKTRNVSRCVGSDKRPGYELVATLVLPRCDLRDVSQSLREDQYIDPDKVELWEDFFRDVRQRDYTFILPGKISPLEDRVVYASAATYESGVTAVTNAEVIPALHKMLQADLRWDPYSLALFTCPIHLPYTLALCTYLP